jgi:uncharacterized protein HemX
MTKYLIAALLALSGLLGWGLYYQIQQNAVLVVERDGATEALERAVERQKLDRQVLVAREAKIASKQRELARAQEALQNALQANKSWSDTDVPDDVQKALGGPSGGLPAGL